ncbi:MAG: hypothetical protein OEW53_10490, partial [Actinomycetota bacterium]|nr:hypothetical protein [Actinomycetota bacterium]
NPSTSVLEDGRTQVLAYVLDRQLRLRVTSPDAERAADLAAGMRVVESPDGCSVAEPTRGVPDPGAPALIDDELVPPGSNVETVCGYRNGWLTESATPSASQGQRIADSLAAALATTTTPAACNVGDGTPAGPGFWLVTLSAPGQPASRVWVYGEGCGRSINARGMVAGLSPDLPGNLWAVASGPFWIGGR